MTLSLKDILQSDVIDHLMHYPCPSCGLEIPFLREDDVECPRCHSVFAVEFDWDEIRCWQSGRLILRIKKVRRNNER